MHHRMSVLNERWGMVCDARCCKVFEWPGVHFRYFLYAITKCIGIHFFLLFFIGYRAIDSLSIEKGYRHWHADIRDDDTPLEAGLGFTCKLKSDTPFLGRGALERQTMEGPKKKLVCLTIDE